MSAAMTAREFYRIKSALDSGKIVRCRRNGRTKTWVRQPDKFRIPVKYGLYDCFYIDNDNADQWSTIPVEPKPAVRKPRRNAATHPLPQ